MSNKHVNVDVLVYYTGDVDETKYHFDERTPLVLFLKDCVGCMSIIDKISIIDYDLDIKVDDMISRIIKYANTETLRKVAGLDE